MSRRMRAIEFDLGICQLMVTPGKEGFNINKF